MIKRCNRPLGLNVDRVRIRRRDRIDSLVLTAAVVVTLLNALGRVLLPLVAVDNILRGQLSPCQRGKVVADGVSAVEFHALAQLHHVFGWRVADHLRRALRQVRRDVLPGRLRVALVHVELAEDRREVGVHRPELRLMGVVPVEHHRVESLRADNSAPHIGRTGLHLTAGVDNLFGPQIGSPIDIGALLRAGAVAAIISTAANNGGHRQAAPGQGSAA